MKVKTYLSYLQCEESEHPNANLSNEEIFVGLLLLGVIFLWVELGIPGNKISEAVDHFATVIDVRTQTAPLNRTQQVVHSLE